MDVLLIMNPQNSFFSPQGSVYMGEKAEILKVRLRDYLSNFSKPKLFFREKHAMQDQFFIGDKTHSIVTSYDFDVVDELKKYATIFYDKTKYNALFDTNLESDLKQKSVKFVGLAGIETHTSVLFTAEDLRNKGYEVEVIEPCTMSRDDYFHGYALNIMQFLGVKVSNG